MHKVTKSKDMKDRYKNLHCMKDITDKGKYENDNISSIQYTSS